MLVFLFKHTFNALVIKVNISMFMTNLFVDNYMFPPDINVSGG